MSGKKFPQIDARGHCHTCRQQLDVDQIATRARAGCSAAVCLPTKSAK